MHGKTIEAFCLFDKQLLCIDCILSDQHKSTSGERHDLTAVDKAASTEREALSQKLTQCQEAQTTLSDQNIRIDKQISLVQS